MKKQGSQSSNESSQSESFSLTPVPVVTELAPRRTAKALTSTTYYKIDGPATINFSGGRTSGYMLSRCIQEGIGPDVHITFADTGVEHPSTYEFIRNVEKYWGVKIEWLKRDAPEGMTPFEALIRERKYLPNPITRFCTEELKIRTIARFMKSKGYTEWTSVIGIRGDEPRRAAKLIKRAEAGHKDARDILMPLYRDRVTNLDVMTFWAKQPFDLNLQSYQGNCTICFLKGSRKKQRIMREEPDLANWWIRMESLFTSSAGSAATFRAHGPTYAQLLRKVQSQPEFDFGDPNEADIDDINDCMCGD